MKDLTNQCNQPVSHTSVPDPPPQSTQEAQLPPPVTDDLRANKYIKHVCALSVRIAAVGFQTEW